MARTNVSIVLITLHLLLIRSAASRAPDSIAELTTTRRTFAFIQYSGWKLRRNHIRAGGARAQEEI